MTGEVKGKQEPDCERPRSPAKQPRLSVKTVGGSDRCTEDNDMTLFQSPVFDIRMSRKGVRVVEMASEDRERKMMFVSIELLVKRWDRDLGLILSSPCVIVS